MLNEAYEIHKSLESAQVSPEAQHPNITVTLGKGIYIRVCLREDGHIERIQSLSDTERVGFWTHTVGNGLWFPIVPLDLTLFDVPEDDSDRKIALDSKGSLEKRVQALQAIIARYPPASFGDAPRKKAELRVQHGRQLLGLLPSLDEIIQRFEKSISGGFFLGDLCSCVVTCLKEGTGDREIWSALVFGTKARFVLDLEESIYNDRTRKQLTQALLHADANASSDLATEIACAFSGKTEALQTGPFPKVPLSTLGKEYPLFSRFHASECNTRYGVTGSDSVPVGRETALQMKDAVTWLLNEERRGKTWRAVASGRMDGKREKRDLLLVYVEGRPNIDVALANYIASGDDDPMEEGAAVSEAELVAELLVSRFTTDTKAVCEALEAIAKEAPHSRLQIALLRKASDGAAFVALSETPSVLNLLDGARWWAEKGRNLPALRIPLIPSVKGAKLQYATPFVPSPGEVVPLFTRQWRRDGTEYTPIGGVMLGEVLPLLLYPERRDNIAPVLLSLLLPRTSVLLIGIGGATYRRDDTWNAFGNPVRRFALRTLGFLGICLSACGREKGTYMNDAPYQVGQMLALADRLHRDYHIVVRSGPMPPSLIGNAHFSMALENPVKALSVLALRMPVYIGWAKTTQVGESASESTRIAVFEARKVLREYETLAAAVHGKLPELMKDIDKAEMLLGYLAGVGKEEETK